MDIDRLTDFTRVYNKHKTGLYHYVLKLTRERMGAEDIVHTIFMKYYDNMNSLQDGSKTEQWLFRVAYNECMRYFRSRNIRFTEDLQSVGQLSSGNYPSDKVELDEIEKTIEAELTHLPEEQTQVFRLRENSDMSYSEIGEVLGIPEDLVRSRLFKARRKIKTALQTFFQ